MVEIKDYLKSFGKVAVRPTKTLGLFASMVAGLYFIPELSDYFQEILKPHEFNIFGRSMNGFMINAGLVGSWVATSTGVDVGLEALVRKARGINRIKVESEIVEE